MGSLPACKYIIQNSTDIGMVERLETWVKRFIVQSSGTRKMDTIWFEGKLDTEIWPVAASLVLDTTFDFLFRIINPAFLLFGVEMWFDFCFRQFFICFYLKVWFVDAFDMVSPITVDLESAHSIFAWAPCFWLFLFHHIIKPPGLDKMFQFTSWGFFHRPVRAAAGRPMTTTCVQKWVNFIHHFVRCQLVDHNAMTETCFTFRVKIMRAIRNDFICKSGKSQK